ncbi:MAG: metallophosphoesterase, partial [Verrucomicrobiota bacterium]|nr:metallophosphoesterase [Verrucomicrobiota bacterium]
ANRDRYSIEYVLHLGDITNNNTSNQWQNAKSALSLLDGVVPYALVPGNHDYGANGGTENRGTQLHTFFPVADCAAWPTFGGVMEPGRLDNSYHLFRAGGVDWLLLALEFGPRDSVVAWAGQIAAQHPSRKKILITHAYTYSDDTRYDWAGKGTAQSWNPHGYPIGSSPDGTNDGEELWRKLVKVYPGFVLVLSGHVLNDGLGRLSTANDFGEVVHQMLVNYQMQAQGGEAVLRLIEFLPDGRTVRVKAYSPLSGVHKTDPQNQFVLTLDPPLR